MKTIRIALRRNSGGPPTPSGSRIGRSSALAREPGGQRAERRRAAAGKTYGRRRAAASTTSAIGRRGQGIRSSVEHGSPEGSRRRPPVGYAAPAPWTSSSSSTPAPRASTTARAARVLGAVAPRHDVRGRRDHGAGPRGASSRRDGRARRLPARRRGRRRRHGQRGRQRPDRDGHGAVVPAGRLDERLRPHDGRRPTGSTSPPRELARPRRRPRACGG